MNLPAKWAWNVEQDDYFFTEHRHKQLLEAIDADRVQLDQLSRS